MKNTNKQTLLPLGVVKDLRHLVENSPTGRERCPTQLHSYTRNGKLCRHSTAATELPRECDAQTYYYILGMLQQARLDNPNDNIRIIRVNVRDIVDGLGFTRARSSYNSVIDAMLRYGKLNIEIFNNGKLKDEADVDFRLFGIEKIKERSSYKLEFTQFYLDLIEDDKELLHYIALDHLVRLSGLATQLYGILTTALYHEENRTVGFTISARTFCKKLFGLERGSELPVSRVFISYIKPRLEEIEEKTGWKVNVAKEGRGENTEFTFFGEQAPNPFDVADIDSETRARIERKNPRADKKKKEAKKAKKKATTPKSQPAATVSLSNTVLSAMPEKARTQKRAIEILSDLIAEKGENATIAVIKEIISRKPRNFTKYLIGIVENDGLEELADELTNNGTTGAHTANEVKGFKYILEIRDEYGEEKALEMAERRSIDYNAALEYEATK